MRRSDTGAQVHDVIARPQQPFEQARRVPLIQAAVWRMKTTGHYTLWSVQSNKYPFETYCDLFASRWQGMASIRLTGGGKA